MKKHDRGLTLEDIAEKCGVSASTVSRVLNNEPGISHDTRQMVLEMAEKNNFSLQKRKRPLTRSQLTLIIVIPDESELSVNPFYNISELLSAINSAFVDEKKTIEILSIADYKKAVKDDSFTKADGTILAFSSIDSDVRAYLVANKIPYVFLNRILQEENYISCNNFQGMIKLGKYLVNRGYQKIGYLGYKKIPINVDRYRGYMIVSMEHMGAFDDDRVQQVDSIEEIDAEIARYFIVSGCDAVMCFNDNFAIRLINEFQLLGKRVPEDIAVTGFDNTPMRKLFKPAITTIDLATYEMGFFAARWLRDNIMNRENREIRMEVDGRLIEGKTVK